MRRMTVRRRRRLPTGRPDKAVMMICLCLPPRGTSPHQASAGTAPSGALTQARGTQSHSALTPLTRPAEAGIGSTRWLAVPEGGAEETPAVATPASAAAGPS